MQTVIFSLIIGILIFSGCNSDNTTPQISKTYYTTECSNFDISRTDLECGVLEVPNDYFNPTSTFTLPIVIKRAKKEAIKSPVIYEVGGPTEKGALIRLSLIDWLSSNFSTFDDRDLIFYNRRGEQYSSSYLSCSSVDESEFQENLKELLGENNTISSITQEQFETSIKSSYRDALIECKNFLQSKGLFKKDFTTRNSAYDIESLRKSLGYEKINLLGVSYGSRLSLEYLELYPENLESVVLDGVLPENSDFMQHSVTQYKEAIERFFELCERDSKCNGAYPNLKDEFLFVMNHLHNKPFFYTFDGDKYNIDGRSLAVKVYENLYSRSNYNTIPYMIHRLYNEIVYDNYTFLESLATTYTEEGDEDLIFNFIHYQDYPINLNTLLAKKDTLGEFTNSYSIYDIMTHNELYEVYGGGKVVQYPYKNNVPVLIITGTLDPVTPYFYAENIDARLQNSTNIVLKNYGHGNFTSNCGKLSLERFWESKNEFTPPDCINDENPIDFFVAEEGE